MRCRRFFLLGFLVPLNAFAAENSAQVPDGFLARDRFVFDPGAPFDRQIGGLCYSPGGEPIVYENAEIRLYGEGPPRVLATFDPPVFGDFLVPAPDGLSIYFGESSAGNIYRVRLDGGGLDLVDNVALNFDLAFAPLGALSGLAGRGFISGSRGFGFKNSIWLLDSDPAGENDEVVTNIPEFSGPVAFDPRGNLYYVTAGADFSMQGGSGQRLVRFTPEQLASGIGEAALDFSAGEVVLSGLGGAFNLECHQEKLYLTNLGLGSCDRAVEVVNTARNFLHTVFARFPVGDCTASPSHLAVHAGSRDFEPGAGPEGGKMLVAYSDFSTVSNVVEITPELFFVRGRINSDEKIDISDAVALLSWLFLTGPEPQSLAAGDVNADGQIDLADAIYLLEFLFRGGPPISAPFPEPGPAPRG